MGQAAMEFLMTYGWAILVVILAISALAYFGVLNFGNLLPETCTLEAGFGCDDFKVDENSVTLVFTNGKGESISISDLQVGGCSGTAFGDVADGDQTTFVIDGCNNTLDEKFKGDINITYTGDTPISHVSSGSVSYGIENGTSQGMLRFIDGFNRTDSDSVGNDWIESESGDATTAILNERLHFDAYDHGNYPLISHSFSERVS